MNVGRQTAHPKTGTQKMDLITKIAIAVLTSLLKSEEHGQPGYGGNPCPVIALCIGLSSAPFGFDPGLIVDVVDGLCMESAIGPAYLERVGAAAVRLNSFGRGEAVEMAKELQLD